MVEGGNAGTGLPGTRVLVPWYSPGPRSTVGVFPCFRIRTGCLFVVKVSNAHLAFYKCAGHIFPDPFQKGFTITKWHTYSHTPNNSGHTIIHNIQTNIHTYIPWYSSTNIHTNIHTTFFVGRGGDCSALPCLPLFHD